LQEEPEIIEMPLELEVSSRHALLCWPRRRAAELTVWRCCALMRRWLMLPLCLRR
jgi:hypothetical protein